MKKYLPALIIFSFLSCKETKKIYSPSFTDVSIDTLMTDSISIRALTADGDRVWYAGSDGKYGSVSLTDGKSFNGIIAQDSIMPEFRAIAKTAKYIFIMNIGTPAKLYKVSGDGRHADVVYTEEGEKVFYDCIKFRND